MDTEEAFIAAYAMSDGVAVAHSETAWNALLGGDIDAALAAQPKFINMRTGEEIGRRAAERFWAATASALRKVSTVDQMNELTARIYRDGPWARRRS